jgi:double-stranded RNA-binding protein Staufen
VKKKNRNLIKEKLEQSTNADEINPISQLIQIQQARKEKEPTYTVIDERGTPRRREFVIEVAAAGMTAVGSGPNKKVAKRIAAENLLVSMGVNKPTAQSSSTPASSASESKEKRDERNKKVSFIDNSGNSSEGTISNTSSSTLNIKKSSKTSSNSSGRQIVPGLILVSTIDNTFTTPSKPTTVSAKSLNADHVADSHLATNTVAVEKTSSSPNSNNSSANDSGIIELSANPRQELNYLAQLIGFTVSYSDFPKANHTEFLSLVTLSTDPPHMSHGSGTTVDESRDHAALKALGVLSELGIDNVKPKAK